MVCKRSVILILLTSSLANCAKLSVEVDVLDPGYFQDVQAELNDQALVNSASHKDAGPAIQAVAAICDQYKEGRLRLYDIVLDVDRGDLNPNQLVALNASRKSREEIFNKDSAIGCSEPSGGAESTSIFDMDEIKETFLKIGCPESSAGGCDDTLSDRGARSFRLSAARQYRGMLEKGKRAISNKLNEDWNAIGIGLDKSLAKIEKSEIVRSEVNQQNDAIISSQSILGKDGTTLARDRLAFAATNSASEEYWEKKYNIATGWGLGGSTDIVIKLNETADFSVKGLVFDARAAAMTARKLTTSTLQILASGTGLPVTIPSTDNAASDEDTETVNIGADLVTAQARIAVQEAQQEHYEAALRRIAASVILSAAAPQDKKENTRTNAQAVFNANRTLLSPQTSE